MPIKKPPAILAWSYSRLTKWEACPAAAKYKFLDKIPEPASPAIARGRTVDDAINDYLKMPKAKLPEEAARFAREFAALRKRGAALFVQRELAFRADWSPCGWFDHDCWLRVKWDYGHEVGRVVKIIDSKTGKIREEQKPQLRLYCLSGLLVTPGADEAKSEYWYLDQGEIVPGGLLRAQVEEEKRYWEGRSAPMLLDRRFPPTPSYKCRWCPFRKEVKGPCPF